MKKWFLLILFFLLSPVGASALSLVPAKIDLTIDPGDKQILEIKIKNNDSVARDFRPVVMGVGQTAAGSPSFVSGLNEIESWAEAKTDNFTLLSGQEKNIQFVIDVPEGSYPGSYYLGLGVEQLSGKKDNINLASRVLSLVNIKVAGVANEAIKINSWKSVRNIWFTPNWNFVLSLQNKGNVELPLRADLVIRNFWGKEIARENLSMGSELIPGAVRDYTPSFSIKEKNIFWSGIFQADIVLEYGLTKQRLVAPIKFWYVYTSAVLVFSVVIFLLIIFLLTKKKFGKRK